MSGIAGLFLIIYGAAAAYLGFQELYVTEIKNLTHIAAFSTLGIGGALAATGLAHFVAPHKAFLMSVPLIAYFHVQSVIDAMFFHNQPLWVAQFALLMGSVLILVLSYRGYKAKQAAAKVTV